MEILEFNKGFNARRRTLEAISPEIGDYALTESQEGKNKTITAMKFP